MRPAHCLMVEAGDGVADVDVGSGCASFGDGRRERRPCHS
ncbi:Hypothetical protein A7982_00126 [Minicystis rosea]|nr:Hypothetical protein A7982_00126 [Minicystis rosea]